MFNNTLITYTSDGEDIIKGHSPLQNITVPVCPLCNQPVPTKRGSDPNVSVDEHIANDCQSDKAKKVTIMFSS